MIFFNSEPMPTHFELAKGYLEGMHPVPMCICELDDEAITQLHGVFSVEGHLMDEAL